jgi:hypothetical protein
VEISEIKAADIDAVYDNWLGAFDALAASEDAMAEQNNILQAYKPNHPKAMEARNKQQELLPGHIQAQRDFRRADIEVRRLEAIIHIYKRIAD